MVTTVLIVDSKIPFMVSLKQALEETGDYRVSMAAHADAAEELLRHDPYDIAVLDFELGGTDAMVLIRLLRKVQPRLPIIITPRDDIQFERAQFMDVQAVLAKPYTARDLLPRLREVQRRPEAYDIESLAAPDTERAPAESLDLDAIEADDTGDEAEADDFDLDRLAKSPRPSAHQDRTRQLHVDASVAGAAYDDDDETFHTSGDYDPYGGHASTPERDADNDEEPETMPPFVSADEPSSAAGPVDDDIDGVDEADDGDSSDTTTLLEWARPDETGHTDEAEHLNAETWRIQPRKRETRPLERHDAPPHTAQSASPDDQDYDDMRGFFSSDPAGESEGFEDVLDAVAQSGEADRTSEDREFHELVESMSRDEPSRPRRSRLEDLLASISAGSEDDAPADADADETVDRMFDTLRQSRSQAAEAQPSDEAEDDGDDTTIGDVIDGLFDPSFEGVLAALSGEDIDEITIEEPTYASDTWYDADRQPEHDTAPDALADEEASEQPPAASTAPSIPAAADPRDTFDDQPGIPYPIIDEPSTDKDDSSTYPATTALFAVSGDDEALSLDELLDQIEAQLPSVHPDRPKLKPLPSWRRAGYLEGASNLARLFDRIEATGDNALPEYRTDDRRWHGPPTSVDEETGELLSIDELFARADLPPEAGTEAAVQDRAQHNAGERDTGPSDEEIAAMFYQGVRDEAAFPAPPPDLPEPHAITEPPFDAASADTQPHAGYEEAEDYEDYEDHEDREEYEAYVDYDREDYATEGDRGRIAEQAEVEFDERVDLAESAAEADVPFVLPDDEHLVSLPVDEATQRIEAASAEEDEADAERAEAEADAANAQIAVHLTQYSLESSAQATMLSRDDELLAHAGHLDDDMIPDLFDAVNRAWNRSMLTAPSLIRMVELPNGDEFLVYSTRLTDNLTLSMAFHTNTSLRLIRRQARRLSESLDLVPDTSEDVTDRAVDDTPPAAKTQISRPTSAAPPPGWRKATADADELPPRPTHEDEPYTVYTALWLPYDPGRELQGDLAEALRDWIRETAEASAWELVDLQIQRDYVALTISAPQKLSPDSVVSHLMERTAERVADTFPELAVSGPLWTDGYYVLTPPRELSDREIARIVTVQRNAQLER